MEFYQKNIVIKMSNKSLRQIAYETVRHISFYERGRWYEGMDIKKD